MMAYLSIQQSSHRTSSIHINYLFVVLCHLPVEAFYVPPFCFLKCPFLFVYSVVYGQFGLVSILFHVDEIVFAMGKTYLSLSVTF